MTAHPSNADPHAGHGHDAHGQAHDAHGHDPHGHGHDAHGHATVGHVAPPASGGLTILVGLLATAGVIAAIGGFLG